VQLPRRGEPARRAQARLPAPAPALRAPRPAGRTRRGLRRGELHLRPPAQRLRYRLRRQPGPAQCRRRRSRGGTGVDRRGSEEPPRRPDLRRPLPVPPSGALARGDRARPALISNKESPMKKLALLTLVAACGGKYQAPPPVSSIALPDGSQLKPYDPSKPGKARPQGLEQAAGRVYVTLSNQRDTDSFPVNAGPGFLAAFVASTGAITLVDLGGADGQQCQNPGFVRASADGRLYTPCSGNFSGTDTARAIVEVDPVANAVTRRAAIPAGRVPNGVAITANKIWTGDAFSTTVFSIDKSSFSADASDPVPVDCAKSVFSYVADVMAIRGGLYALCGSDISGELYQLNPDTGAALAHVTVGPNPTEL